MTKKSTFVPAKDLSKLWRAIIEFDMLQPGDRILVGLSGGKDSMLLTAMLAEIKNIRRFPSTLPATPSTACLHPTSPRQSWRTFARSSALHTTVTMLT